MSTTILSRGRADVEDEKIKLHRDCRAGLVAAIARHVYSRLPKMKQILEDCQSTPRLRSPECAGSYFSKQEAAICQRLCRGAGLAPVHAAANKQATKCFERWKVKRSIRCEGDGYSSDGATTSAFKKRLAKRFAELRLERDQSDTAAWQRAAPSCRKPKTSSDCDDLKRYLEKYPDGVNTADAKKLLRQKALQISLLASREAAERRRQEAREAAEARREAAREAAEARREAAASAKRCRVWRQRRRSYGSCRGYCATKNRFNRGGFDLGYKLCMSWCVHCH